MAAVTFLTGAHVVTAQIPAGTTLLQAQILAGLHPDAPCGGQGRCGKCTVFVDGRPVPACRTQVTGDVTVTLPHSSCAAADASAGTVYPTDGLDRYALAFDVGTTTVVGFLLDGVSGQELGCAAVRNPQSAYGADVISRIRCVLAGGGAEMSACIRSALEDLTAQLCAQAGISPQNVTRAALVGNTAMHHLLLGIDPAPLAAPPYMPAVREAMELPFDGGTARILPNIAGFVGADTAACMTALRFDELDELSLLIDVGTNGEMVLGDRTRRMACSAAAGPAFEGAQICCGMRGVPGAVEHVRLENGALQWSVIGGGRAEGLCGSGLLDLTAALLELGVIRSDGRMQGREYRLGDTGVVLTQKDVRQVQLAKAAFRVGVELLCKTMGVRLSDVRTVYLAGAFGTHMDPASACRIGMLPPELLPKIRSAGNAAGEGAKLCALSRDAFERSRALARSTEFLELASAPDFQDCYLKALDF